jgi:hypothetical protein
MQLMYIGKLSINWQVKRTEASYLKWTRGQKYISAVYLNILNI